MGMGYVFPHMLALSNSRVDVEVVSTASFIPNMTSRIAYSRQLSRLDAPMRLLSTTIESYLDAGKIWD